MRETPLGSIWQGTFTAIVTPFTEDGSAVDYDSLSALVDYQLAGGVEGLVIAGSTGEAATLSEEEYYQVIQAVVARVAGRIPCVAGLNSNNTLRACQLARNLQEFSLAAMLVVCPPYNKPSQEGLYQHFKAVKSASRLPIIAYNIPGRTAVNMLPATIARLHRDGLIAAVKESSGSLDQNLDLLAAANCELPLLSGDDSFTLSLVLSGGKGSISTVANVAPAMTGQLVRSALLDKVAEARTLQFRLLPLIRALFLETNPVPVKCALALKKVIKSPAVRLPLMPAAASTTDRLTELLQGGFE